MAVAYFVVTLITILANAGMAAADLRQAEFVLATSAEVGVKRSWLPVLGGLKAAAAVGLLVGLMGTRSVGIAAAGGLVTFFIGAETVHVRARVFHNIAFPCAFLALAMAALGLGLAR
jgi:hypothetical protein